MGMTQIVKRFHDFKHCVNSADGAERVEYAWESKPEHIEKRDGLKLEISGPSSAPGRRTRSFCSVCQCLAQN